MLKTTVAIALATSLPSIGCSQSNPMERHVAALEQAGITVDTALMLQEDSDTLRREHLLYWTGLIEEYHAATGSYPFMDVEAGTIANFVSIATPDQRRILDTTDYLKNNAFKDVAFKDFKAELERSLGRSVTAKFDPSLDPNAMPVYYSYFGTQDGYLFYVTCRSCGATTISTLLMYEPFLPSLNIASEGMIPNVTKAQSRASMVDNGYWQLWDSLGFHDEEKIREIERRMTASASG